ncbi:formyltetrahydrofolate deformylase [Salsuginibacillus halophilus]|uniref:Formyltetrahydrofolate deformylase n=1 Tax=Salsuginibacillus halophilus TaxID=517424 RepID=A0A2P8HE72_9BACI|nr:formyltetrahydrofolate deformylase [Salsuginibacillus halophilus]PSL44527.1 formyltetrahydrofolate deformylase [Salsuginibacillus halophilus]
MSEAIHQERARLLISCPDRPGIVRAVSTFLHQEEANIVQSDQYSTDPKGGMFFMRVVFDFPSEQKIEALRTAFEQVGVQFGMHWRMTLAAEKKRMAIFVSKEDHCLLELLWRHKNGELNVDIPVVVSNHESLRSTVESYGLSFYHIPVQKERKREAEQQAVEVLHAHNVDVVVLARYMQILSPEFVESFPNQIINIHHSFLPAFIGANPYKKAFERGVKLIGATAHYVTDDLDEGPIIEQDVLRVNHRHSAEDLRVAGRNVEKISLARAVEWHVDDKVLVFGNKTVVFN